MRSDPPASSRSRLANLATAVAVALCAVVAVVSTRSADPPAPPAAVPLVDGAAAGRDADTWLEEDAASSTSPDSAAGDALWRDRAGKGERERPRRAKREDRRARERGRARERRDRVGERRTDGSEPRRHADRAGGAGKSIPAAPSAGSTPRRQDPPATAPGPGPTAPAVSPEFAIG